MEPAVAFSNLPNHYSLGETVKHSDCGSAGNLAYILIR